MATIESNFEKLRLTESTQKGKGEMLQAHKSSKDGKLHQSGEDSVDAVPSNNVPTVTFLKGSIKPTQQFQHLNVERDEDVERREPGDGTDAVPSSRPTASAENMQQPNFPIIKWETRTRSYPSAVPGPGARCEGGERVGAKGTTVEQAINLEEEKDLLLYEIAEKVAGVCDLRKMALRLEITESEVARMEHEFPRLVTQFYQVFQIFSQRVPNASEMFKRLLDVLTKTDQESTAVWLKKRLGIKDSVAAIEGKESVRPVADVKPERKASQGSGNNEFYDSFLMHSGLGIKDSEAAIEGKESVRPVADVKPERKASQGSGNNEFYDIFLMHSGKSDSTEKFQGICQRHNWTVKTLDAIPVGEQPHDIIERTLVTSTHLALIITESDCIKYRNHEMSTTVEMALQLAYTSGALSGRVLPIRCCQKTSLPLVLQALTGAHIDEDNFEERLMETIDTRKRLERMRENQD